MIDLRYEGLTADHRDLARIVEDALSGSLDDHRAGSDLGWGSVGIDEALGGSGGTATDRAVIAEQAGAVHAGTVVPWTAGVVLPLLTAGAVSGDVVDSLLAGSAAAVPLGSPIELAASWGAGDLTGSFTALGPVDSEHVLVPVLEGGTPSLLVLAGSAPGVSLSALELVDHARPWVRVELDGVPRSAASASVSAPDLFEDWVGHVAVVAALDAAGSARATLARTLQYAVDRKQFDRQIASFQAIKHRFADLFIQFKTSQSLAFRSAAELAEGNRVPALSAGLASTAAAMFVAGDCVQLHGGLGYTYEAGLHWHVRRCRTDEVIAAAGGATARMLLAESAAQS